MVLRQPYAAFREPHPDKSEEIKEYLISRLKSKDNSLVYSGLDSSETVLDPELALQLVIVGDSADVPVLRRRVFTAEQMAKNGRYDEFRNHFFAALQIQKQRAKEFRARGDSLASPPKSLESIAVRLASKYFE